MRSILLCLFSLSVSLLLSLTLLEKTDYSYKIFHEFAEVDKHVKRYTWRNPEKADFTESKPAQQIAAFHEISAAVNSMSLLTWSDESYSNEAYQVFNKLSAISYKINDNTKPLLVKAEVDHLVDVAWFIVKLEQVLITTCVVSLILLVAMFREKLGHFCIRTYYRNYLAVLSVLALIGLILGFERIFYQFHIWIFPPQNQWLFSHKYSLMVTLMKAPQLFAYIGVVLLIVTMAWNWLILRLVQMSVRFHPKLA